MTPDPPRHAKRHDTAARVGYLSCAAILLAAVVLLVTDPGLGAVGIWAGAFAIACGLACRIYLSRGQS